MSGFLQIPTPRLLEAAERLVQVPREQRRRAARQLVRSAPEHGIDLSLLFGYINPQTDRVEQVCLIVPAAGRTAMVYLSAPNEAFPESDQQHEVRTMVLRTAFEAIDSSMRDRVHLAQALAGLDEPWAQAACLDAGMSEIGTLAYLKRPIRSGDCPMEIGAQLSEGIELRGAGDLDSPSDRARLGEALERTYIDTLDCPGLCEMREIDDVIDSHRATGVYDPALWWVVCLNGEPHGAMLLARYPEQSAMELVYVGLSPELRGKGIGRLLLAHALGAAVRSDATEMTCAVDTNNLSAIKLYDHAGFERFDARVALVRSCGK